MTVMGHMGQKMMMTKILLKNGFVYGSGVPCSILKKEIAEIEDTQEIFYVPAVDEGVALGLVNGFMLAGKSAFLLTQNSAVGRVADLVMSFNISYDMPLFWIISMRGYNGDTRVHLASYGATYTILEYLNFAIFDFRIKGKEFENALNYYIKNKKNTVFLRYKND